ncbi:MAG: TRAP transporter substrate-binding protein DctP, partial [Pseudorhodoplanes sp.]
MKRRQFIATLGAGAAASAVAAPAIAQSSPEIKWRLTSSFPKSLDTLWGGAETFCKAVAEATDNKFQIQPFSAGEIVPGLQAADAVTNGNVEMCQTASYYYFGKDPTFALACAIPFGLNTRMQNSWMYQHGGSKLLDEFYAKFKFIALPAGNTTCQMGGWYRKEIKEVSDLQGLKFRIAGIAGTVLQKLGVVPQQLAGGDIYPALEKGTIDAAEWVGPYDDEKLGFHKVAKYYYFPGWWEGGAMLHMIVNDEKWNSLSKQYQAIVNQAGAAAGAWMVEKYDSVNPAALKRLIAGGAELRAFPQPVLDVCYQTTQEHLNEIAEKSPLFKKTKESHDAYMKEVLFYTQIAENYYDNYLL